MLTLRSPDDKTGNQGGPGNFWKSLGLSRGARTRDSVLGPLPSGLLLTSCLPSKVLGPTLLFKFLLSLSKSETSLNFIFLIYKVKKLALVINWARIRSSGLAIRPHSFLKTSANLEGSPNYLWFENSLEGLTDLRESCCSHG